MFQPKDPSELEDLEIFEKRAGKAAAPAPRKISMQPNLLNQLKKNPLLWQGKIAPAFWTITGIFSLAVNITLLIILVVLVRELFTFKNLVSNQLIDGLSTNFQLMDAAVIDTTVSLEEIVTVTDSIVVVDTIPVVFDLPLQQETVVRLSEDTPISDAVVNITTPFFSVNNAPASIVLPADTELPTNLNLMVPVSQTVPIELTVPISLDVPVTLDVPVSIPLNQTQLHEPFVGLQGVLDPYQNLLANSPDSWSEAACQAGPVLCWLLGSEG